MIQILRNAAVISVPQLVSTIVGEISFMQSELSCVMLLDGMMLPNFPIDLNEVQSSAVKFFLPININSEFDFIIESDPETLQFSISKFLNKYKEFVDVVAVQQNIHNKINIMGGAE